MSILSPPVRVDNLGQATDRGKSLLKAASDAAARSAIGAAGSDDVAAAITAADIPGQIATAVAADGSGRNTSWCRTPRGEPHPTLGGVHQLPER